MIYEEANNIIDDISWVYNGKTITEEMRDECRDLCHEALEKQIPKKPNYNSTGLLEYWYCPTCGEVVFSKIDGLTIIGERKPRHCSGCGQAINWSEE